jgi:hypothetical protein
MGKLKPFSKFEGNGVGLSITADKSNRICLNVGLRKVLGIEDNKVDVYVYFDEEDRRIGISKTCNDSNIVPFTFDNRGYAPGKEFWKKCEVDTRETPTIFYYEGMEDDVYVFGTVGRRRTSMRMEKNGNLERLG